MKLVAIMGSPRKNGNTSALLQHLEKQKPENWEMEIVALGDYQINGCTGCSQCQKESAPFRCVQADAVNGLLEKIVHADAVLYGTPLYGHNYSGQLKIFLDRHTPLFKFVEGKEKAVGEMEIVSAIDHKPVGLVVSCQGPEEDNTELIKMMFDRFCESSLATCVGKYVFPFCQPTVQASYYDEAIFEKIWQDIVNQVEGTK